jgi:hypothetical protein
MHGEGADPGTGSALISPMEPPLEARGLVRTYGRLTAHSALAQVISPIEIARWGPSLVLLALVVRGTRAPWRARSSFSVADLGHLVLGSPLSRRALVAPPLARALAAAALTGPALIAAAALALAGALAGRTGRQIDEWSGPWGWALQAGGGASTARFVGATAGISPSRRPAPAPACRGSAAAA